MKKNILFLTLVAILTSCATFKKSTNKTNSENQKPIAVELTLKEKPENFQWNRGSYIDLQATITNKSNVPITVLIPKSSHQADRDFFSVNFIEDFDGMECVFNTSEESTKRTPDEFKVILPNESQDFYMFGRNYFVQYCNTKNTNSEVKLNIRYNNYYIKNDSNNDLVPLKLESNIITIKVEQ